MVLFAVTVALSFLGPLVNAQSSNTALGIAGIEANFQNAHIVPDLLSTFGPTAVMNVNFSGVGEISAGQNLTRSQASTEPELAIVPGSGFNASASGSYTLLMVDADVVGTKETVKNQTCHWLVNGATLSNSSATERNVSTTGGTSVIDYAGPAPPEGSGPHRYVILLFAQPMTFAPPTDLSKSGTAVTTVNLTEYVSETKLGEPIAGMYFTVQQGTTNVTLTPTSAVVSSTLLPATASGSGTATGSGASKSTSKPNAALRSGSPVLAIPVAVFLLFASYIYL